MQKAFAGLQTAGYIVPLLQMISDATNYIGQRLRQAIEEGESSARYFSQQLRRASRSVKECEKRLEEEHQYLEEMSTLQRYVWTPHIGKHYLNAFNQNSSSA